MNTLPLGRQCVNPSLCNFLKHWNKDVLVKLLADHVFGPDSPLAGDAVRSISVPTDNVDHLVDDIAAEVYEMLEPDVKDGFKDFGASIRTKPMREKAKLGKDILAKAKARANFKAKAKAKAKPKLAGVAEEPPPPPDAPAPPRAGGSFADGASGESFKWGPFTIGRSAGTLMRKPQVYARCPFHDAEMSFSGSGFNYCTRTWSITEGRTEDEMIRKLKFWLTSGDLRDSNRRTHMNLHRDAVRIDMSGITDADLDIRRRDYDNEAMRRGLHVSS